MIPFRYVARTAAGERVRGTLVAADRDAAIAGLQGRALFVTTVERARAWNGGARLSFGFGAPTNRSRIAFFRSFSTLIRAGVAMRRALEVTIARTAHDGLRDSLREVLAEIERGDALSEALARRPRAFPPLIVAMIAAGEAGGILDDVLERVATLLERDGELRQNVLAALAYPATVLVASLALVVFLIARIVPMFEELFASFHLALPLSTRVLLWLGRRFGEPLPWIVAGAAAIGLGAAAGYARRTRAGALAFDRARFAVPVVGTLLRLTIHARFARMLGTLVHSGVELTRALDAVMPVTASPVHQAALERAAVALREGEPLAQPLGATRTFDPMLVTLVAVGEETGMLDVMLDKAADYFESDVAAAIATLGAVIEPALIVALGAIVGTIVYSVYIPLYSLIGSLAK
jgi:type IV pilus assembly protein PilC